MQLNNGKSDLFGENKRTTLFSSTDNSYRSNLTAYNIAVPVSFRHAFAKKGRTFSVEANPSYNASNGISRLETYNNYYVDSVYTDSIDQRSILDKTGINATGNLMYTCLLYTSRCV